MKMKVFNIIIIYILKLKYFQKLKKRRKKDRYKDKWKKRKQSEILNV